VIPDLDWTGAQIGNNNSKLIPRNTISSAVIGIVGSDDIKNVDLTKVHNLTGPVAVEGAEPGDCLVVDILDGKQQLIFQI
jgi:formamidase